MKEDIKNVLEKKPIFTKTEIEILKVGNEYIKNKAKAGISVPDIAAELGNMPIEIIQDIVDERDNFSRGFYEIVEDENIEDN